MKIGLEKFLMICLVGVYSSIEENNKFQLEDHLTTVQLIENHGYPVEVHEVVTEDGYILTMFRIPHGKRGTRVNGKPFLLMHGILGMAESFAINGVNGSLAYFLAENDHDVWLGNNRGTRYGMKHNNLSPATREFWNFSVHELGIYDLPVKIDYILKITNTKSIFYCGHSQGGTIFYIMASLRPEYQKKIALATLLAPGGYENHFRNPYLLFLARRHKAFTMIADVLNIYAFPPPELLLNKFIIDACSTIMRYPCLTLFSEILEMDMADINEALYPLMLTQLTTASTKQLIHFAQWITSGHFRPWDYGKHKNMEVYGSSVPDDYPVRFIKVTTAMFFSNRDRFAFKEDIENMCHAIGNCVYKYIIKDENWSHFDYLIGKNIVEKLFVPLKEFISIYDVEE